MKRNAVPMGECPKCKTPMRSHGLITYETTSMRRIHKASGDCDKCVNGATPGVGRKARWTWTPEELAEAVGIGMAKLFD